MNWSIENHPQDQVSHLGDHFRPMVHLGIFCICVAETFYFDPEKMSKNIG